MRNVMQTPLSRGYKPQVVQTTGWDREGYFSQSGQDVFLDRLFRRSTGFFVDIGAHDGVTFSNSLYFENKGWQGLCIEANPKVFQSLVGNRSCGVVNVAAGTREGIVEFAEISGYPEMLSGVIDTYPRAHLRRIRGELREHGGKLNLTEVKMEPLALTFDRFGIQHADFVSIDIEGGELEAIRGIDFGSFSANVLLVENNYGSAKAANHLAKHGYRRIFRVGADDVFFGPELIGLSG